MYLQIPMDSTQIKQTILAGSDTDEMKEIAYLSGHMFFALARVSGYGTNPAYTNFVNMFNEISVLGEGAVRQMEALRLAAERNGGADAESRELANDFIQRADPANYDEEVPDSDTEI